MAVVYRIRPFLWTQIRSRCVFAFTNISAISNWQIAKAAWGSWLLALGNSGVQV